MLRLLAALALVASLSATAHAQLTGEGRRQIPQGADWKALFSGRGHYYLFGTLDRPLERSAFRVFRSDGTYRVQAINDPNQVTDGRWYFQSDGVCQEAHSRAYCYAFSRLPDGWAQRSNDGANFSVFIPDVLPPDIRLPF